MAATRKPNILFIMSDDIGWFNISCNNNGMMGYRTPNIDRIAKEGANFTDFYGQQSCTAGRAAFITGQSPIRTGLTKVGMPAPRWAEGRGSDDRPVPQESRLCHRPVRQEPPRRSQRALPTVHGFDEFFGNLYHLNAEEEPEYPDWPKGKEFNDKFRPRGVLKCKATDKDDATVDPKYGRVGRQTIENTGPLNRKRMETVDEEFLGAALDFMERKTKEGGPWLCYMNTTRMHIFTHLKPPPSARAAMVSIPTAWSSWTAMSAAARQA
jgi:arylsulfatase